MQSITVTLSEKLSKGPVVPEPFPFARVVQLLTATHA